MCVDEELIKVLVNRHKDRHKELHEFRAACYAKDAHKAGHIQHRLRCKFGMNFNEIWQASGMMRDDFDELMQVSEYDSELNNYSF